MPELQTIDLESPPPQEPKKKKNQEQPKKTAGQKDEPKEDEEFASSSSLFSSYQKWFIVGTIGLIAIIMLVTVRKRNSSDPTLLVPAPTYESSSNTTEPTMAPISTNAPTHIPRIATLAPTTDPQGGYTPPSPQECQDIALGQLLPGQENMLVELLDVEVDVSLEFGQNVKNGMAGLLPTLQDAMQERFVPALSHCPFDGTNRRSLATDNPKYVVANTFLQVQNRPDVSCSLGSPPPCGRVVVKLELFLKGHEYMSTLMQLVFDVQNERPLLETLGLGAPFSNINIAEINPGEPSNR